MNERLAYATCALALGLWILRKCRTSPAPPADLPPGPRGLPLLGSVFQIPEKHLATYFRRLCQEYGDIVSVNMAGTPIILLGNIDLAKEIMEKRSGRFSGRATVPYYRYLDPEQLYWVFSSDRTHFVGRKLTTAVLARVRMGETEPLQQFESLNSMNRLLEDRGRHWFHEMDRTSASGVLTAAFGLHCPTGEEPELKRIVASLSEIVSLFNPSASIINILPFLDYLPGPMPWRTRAADFLRRETELYSQLVRNAVSGDAAGMNTWAAEFASEDNPEGDQSPLMKMFSNAAIETTTSAMQTFVLACIRYPEWIPRAQAQINAVVGADRIPTFKDRPNLPYVEALVRETLRWRSPARFGVPHLSTADDVVEYKGKSYFIPEGSIVYALPWVIEHDKNQYDHPDEFRPERFLDDQGELKTGYETSVFGFGRRVCPGIPFAERSMWINIAMMLWTFDIRKSEEADPRTGLLFQYGDSDEQFKGDFTNPPLEFPAVFTPRSARHGEIIRQEWDGCEKDLNVLLPQRRHREFSA